MGRTHTSASNPVARGTSSTFAWNAVAMFAMISSSASFPAATSRAIWLRIDSAAEARDT